MTEMTQNAMNTAPGFLCPGCGRMRIMLTLESFLSAREVRCPSCGLSFDMDKSQCTQLVEMLQDLYVVTENVKGLRRQNL
jgi:transcription elongation factor Elf1